VGIARYSIRNVIATFIVFSISSLVFNKIDYSFAMSAVCNFIKRKPAFIESYDFACLVPFFRKIKANYSI